MPRCIVGAFFSKTMPACQDKVTIEKLVELVRDNPVLYNFSLPEHRDALLIRNVWNSIAEAMRNRCIHGDGWKKKWRNIRHTYMKKKKDSVTNSSQAATRRKPWLLFNILTFLDEFIEPSSTESNIPSPHPESQDDEESEARLLALDQSDDESAIFAGRASVVSFVSQSTGSGHGSGSSLSAVDLAAVRESSLPSRKNPAKKARRGDEPTIDRALQELIADHKRIQEIEEHLADTHDPDGDDAFPASYACRMRKLPAQTKSFLRVQIAQLFLKLRIQISRSYPSLLYLRSLSNPVHLQRFILGKAKMSVSFKQVPTWLPSLSKVVWGAALLPMQ